MKRLDTEEANDTRMYIIEALGVLADWQILPKLTDTIDRDFIGIRNWAIKTIGQIAEINGPKIGEDGRFESDSKSMSFSGWLGVLDALEKVVLSSETPKEEICVEKLEPKGIEIRRQDLENRFNKNCKENLAINAIDTLSSIGGREAFNHLLTVLSKHRDHLMVARATGAIVSMRNFQEPEIKTNLDLTREEWDVLDNPFIISAIKDISKLLDHRELQYQVMGCLEMLIKKLDEKTQVDCLVSLIKYSNKEILTPLSWLARNMRYDEVRMKLTEVEQGAFDKSDDKTKADDVSIGHQAGEAIIEMGGPALVDSLRIQRDLIAPIRQGAISASQLLKQSEENMNKSFIITKWSSIALMLFGFSLIAITLTAAMLGTQIGAQGVVIGTGGFITLLTTYIVSFIKQPGKDIQDAASNTLAIQLPFMRYVHTFSQSLLIAQNRFRKGKLKLKDLKYIDDLVGKAADDSLKQLLRELKKTKDNLMRKPIDTFSNKLLHIRKEQRKNGEKRSREKKSI